MVQEYCCIFCRGLGQSDLEVPAETVVLGNKYSIAHSMGGYCALPSPPLLVHVSVGVYTLLVVLKDRDSQNQTVKVGGTSGGHI